MIMQVKRKSPSAQSGMVLVTSLLLLIVVTLLALGMFRSFGLDEKIAGNVREKQRALSAAETAEQYAEYWLTNSNSNTSGITCTAPPVSSTVGQVCTNPLTNVTQLPWATGVTYVPTVTSAMNITQSGGQNTYFGTPTFYIAFLGPSQNGLGKLYQIDAVGYGGSADTAAVVESTYIVSSSVKDLGAL
jgi:type IV pilus assembly protein PilX